MSATHIEKNASSKLHKGEMILKKIVDSLPFPEIPQRRAPGGQCAAGWATLCSRGRIQPGRTAQAGVPTPRFAHLVVHEAHVPGVERCGPLAAVAWVDGSGQLLQRPLVVGVELVGQGQMQLLGARLHGAVCDIRGTRG